MRNVLSNETCRADAWPLLQEECILSSMCYEYFYQPWSDTVVEQRLRTEGMKSPIDMSDGHWREAGSVEKSSTVVPYLNIATLSYYLTTVPKVGTVATTALPGILAGKPRRNHVMRQGTKPWSRGQVGKFTEAKFNGKPRPR